MASSGVFKGIIGLDNNFSLKCEWTQEKISGTRKSKIKAIGYLKKVNSGVDPFNNNADGYDCTLSCAGVTRSCSGSYNLVGSQGLNYREVINTTSDAFEVTHNSDGTKSITLTLSFNGKLSSYYPNGDITEQITLDPIDPIADDFTCSSSMYLGNDYTISFSSGNTNKHQLQFIYGNFVDSSTVKGAGSFTTHPTKSFASKFASNSNSLSATVRVYTIVNDVKVGYKDKTVTLKIPNNTADCSPTFSHTFAPYSSNSKVTDFCSANGLYLKNFSGVRLSITSAKALNGASVSKAALVLSDWYDTVKNGSGTSFTIDSGTLTKDVGSNIRTVKAKVTDTRGVYTESSATDIFIAPYSLSKYVPSESNVERSDVAGQTLYDHIVISGLTLTDYIQSQVLLPNGSLFDLSDYEYAETPSITVQYKKQTESQWSAATVTGGKSDIENTEKRFPYDVKITITDYLGNTAETVVKVPSAQVDFHMINAHARFGSYVDPVKLANDPSIEVDWDAYFGGDHFYIKNANGVYIDIISKLRNL